MTTSEQTCSLCLPDRASHEEACGIAQEAYLKRLIKETFEMERLLSMFSFFESIKIKAPKGGN